MRIRIACFGTFILGTMVIGLHSKGNEIAAPYPGRKPMDAYLAERTREIESHCLQGIKTAEQWNSRRPELHRQLPDMLGLNPWPERTDLKPVIVGQSQHEGYSLERLHFQSRPGLYVSANLYLPSVVDQPLPTILYVCGHARMKEDGVSYGNKAGYHHHGIWFARHGYVCMIIDTIQLGEIEGTHHGTYSKGMWWWASRGYTPAGVEAWNSIRALDYLQTRPEVDPERLGMTGRSGGGAYTWWAAALDPRVRVVVPVAGITDMRNHIVDDCIEGHCDCMFMVNQYRWDFATLAALIAPRPLLIANSHRDSIFPLDGVIRVYNKTATVYDALDASDQLAIHITEGPHKDTQTLRYGAFAWFEKFLKGSSDELEGVARQELSLEQMQVFAGGIPDDEKVTNVHEWFVGQPPLAEKPHDTTHWTSLRQAWLDPLREVPGALANVQGFDLKSATTLAVNRINGANFHDLRIDSDSPLASFAMMVTPVSNEPVDAVRVCVGTPQDDEIHFVASGSSVHYDVASDEFVDPSLISKLAIQKNEAILFLSLQGTGKSRWDESERETIHLRRRLHLVGQSLERAIRVSEIRGLLDLIANEAIELPKMNRVVVEATGQESVLAMLAVLENPQVKLVLHQIPDSLDQGPILLGLNKATDLSRLVALAFAERHVVVEDSSSGAIEFVDSIADQLNCDLERR